MIGISRGGGATAPAVWPDAGAYDAAVRGYIARDAALDERSVPRTLLHGPRLHGLMG
jgi:hypothetical protein